MGSDKVCYDKLLYYSFRYFTIYNFLFKKKNNNNYLLLI